jgi:hypothetical protein
LSCCDKILDINDINDLREKLFILTHSFRSFSHHPWLSWSCAYGEAEHQWLWEHMAEATNLIADRKQKERECWHSGFVFFPLFISSSPQTFGLVPLTLKVGLPFWGIPLWKQPHRHIQKSANLLGGSQSNKVNQDLPSQIYCIQHFC